MVTAALLSLALALPSGGVPTPLLSSLTTGGNITRWFCYLDGADHTSHFAHYLTPSDFDEFKKLHYRFVRLCISPDVIYERGDFSAPVMAALDEAVQTLNDHGLTVIWDLHDNGQLKLDTPEGDKPAFTRFWQKVAEHYKNRSENSMVFELLNEPQFQKNPSDWYALQDETVQAIRKTDRKRTIMVSGTSWSSIDTLAKMKPLTEANLVYTFHCYDPFFFTHQGAEWVGEYPGHFKQIPFPSSPEAVEKILPLNDPKYRAALEDYGNQRYGDEYLESRLAKAVDWGKENRVPVLFGEFGSYPKVSPPDSRARWFEGMRKAIDKLHVPNAIWGYDDGMGLGRSVEADGTLKLDPLTLKYFYER
jgi:endoglucanase